MENKITINLENKPNLMALQELNPDKFIEVLQVMIGLAEEVANPQRSLPWYKVNEHVGSGLSFSDLMSAVIEAFFDIESIDPNNYSVLGFDLHPLSLLRKKPIGSNVYYTNWKNHFLMPEDAEVSRETIKNIIRRMLYYSRYINMSEFGKAFMMRQLEVHKALPVENMEKLPFYPALKYQQENLGDLHVGQFWPEIGVLKGGELPKAHEIICPACGVEEMRDIPGFKVCVHCNIGFKLV